MEKTTTETMVQRLVNCVRRGILTPGEALAKEYLTPAERKELHKALTDAGELDTDD